ncbi:ATP-binding cassette sub-family A member 6 [Camelus dromedarius]|uniref:ATP-binding cassette sub-family A member 6 n=1 Tax=Camelus dromedarius TaxID=9838 RepID=A0A5N4D4E4_CAMDR|nr:ATP-binding cassette sub-family A member 6 [Camelus dromedarius]
MHMKQKSVYQQTQALLCKNFLKKWRMKRESSLEWGFPILVGLYMGTFLFFKENVHFPEIPSQDLGRVDKFNSSSMNLLYTPISNITQQIMNKTAFAPFLKAQCGDIANEFSCSLAKYWATGFLTLQTAINAAIIQRKQLWTERKAAAAVLALLVVYFVDPELSWGLLYAGFIFITSIVIALTITSTQIIVMTGFMVIFALFFTYGLSLIIRLDYNMYGMIFPDASGDSYIMIATFSILAFDAFFYLVLALYLDKILPYGNERRYSPLFFLSSSSCFQHQRTSNKIIEKEIDPEHPSDDYFEPVPPEFQGREAIRIRNVKKEYKGKTGKVEVLKGLFFDIYEGQITAILGRSGAGKSSLLNILNGLSVPTEGSVTIYNKNPSEMQDLEEIQMITGVCPQRNVQFDTLTVKENLRLFAKIKGIQPQEVEQEVQRILLELDIQNIQDSLAVQLSEGQKRKLTLGIAILGDPQILLLDEPTAGLDPFSRHRVWSFLKERKADRVILLSTHFIDEADVLADRKVIMSSGRLKCAGSSVFLKRRWGLGYHLRAQGPMLSEASINQVNLVAERGLCLTRNLCRNETCDPEKITSFIKHHIPDAKLKAESKEKLVYALPVERTNNFPDLFSDLDKGSGQGVMSYDISMSTLNEVFMKLEGKSTTEQDFEQAEMIRDTGSRHEMEPACFSLPETQKAVSGMRLWRMQFCAIARLRFLKLKHGKKALLTLLFVFGIAMLPLIAERIHYVILSQKTSWEFKPELYFLSPGQLPQDLRTSLLIINNTESDIEDFIQSLKHQNILLEIDDFENRNGTDDPSYNGAIIVSGKQKAYRFSVVCNTKRLHCFPILMNVISNGLLRMFNHTQCIRTERSSFPFIYAPFWTGLPEGSFFLFFVVCSLSPYIAMHSVSDYKRRTKSQLWISGLHASAYWCGQALVDVNLYNFILLSMYLTFYIVNLLPIYLTSRIVFAFAVITFGYAASLVFLTYVISFILRERRKNSGLWSFCFYISVLLCMSSKGEQRIRVHTLCLLVVSTLNKVFFRADGQAMSGLLATMAVDSSVTVSLTEARNIPLDSLSDEGSSTSAADRTSAPDPSAFSEKQKRGGALLRDADSGVSSVITFSILAEFDSLPIWIVGMILVPSMTLGGFVVFLEERAHKSEINYPDPNYDLNAADLLLCLIPYFQALLFIFVLRCLEIKCGNKIMQKDPVFRISPKSRDARPNPEEPVDEDEDVQTERIRTATALTTSIEEKPVIIASCLHKEYAGQKKSCCSKRKKKIAVRNISFCVKKGEILGLLGPNGAGKSSSIRMVSGIMKPTAGEVELTGYDSVLDHRGDGSVKFLGYCPQENVLWPTLTAREHLEVFAAVKGLRKADATVTISRLVEAFKLHEQLNVPVQKLMTGATRKLCFVLSILGNPPILLLDEPSTGMDPTEQQQMWQTIQTAIKNTERGALLTTHHMAEAEAICDRVAILVSGRLRFIGSIQHLKNKLGKDYILELKVKETSQAALVHTEILRLFPQAATQERYSSFLTYKLPVEDAHPLSQAFHKLEAVKCNFNLEEYNLSHCTLEKVFLELSKEQEPGDFDREVDTTVRWKLLPHSEDP